MKLNTEGWKRLNVRAWNVKQGDVLSFWNDRRRREVRRIIRSVEPSLEHEGEVWIHFKRWPPVLCVKRNSLLRVRRPEAA